jgi:hypothetical protein
MHIAFFCCAAQAAMSEAQDESDGERDGLAGLLGSDSDSDCEAAAESESTLATTSYTRTQAPEGVLQTLTLRLVSSRHSLWGHLLWNARYLLVDFPCRPISKCIVMHSKLMPDLMPDLMLLCSIAGAFPTLERQYTLG